MNESLFHHALLRPMLVMGGEREITLVCVLLSSVVAYSGFLGQSLFVFIIGLVMVTVLLSAVRMMAKADPYAVKVYIRHIKYAKFYPARSTPWRVN